MVESTVHVPAARSKAWVSSKYSKPAVSFSKRSYDRQRVNIHRIGWLYYFLNLRFVTLAKIAGEWQKVWRASNSLLMVDGLMVLRTEVIAHKQ